MSVAENKALLLKYPFLLPHNHYTGKVPHDYDYSYTELDFMPEGWRKAFGEQMCHDIAEELEKHGLLYEFVILDIKEKYGRLRLYGAPLTDKLRNEIIPYYEELSERTCPVCQVYASDFDILEEEN